MAFKVKNTVRKQKVYELTTNGRAGYTKYYVRGIKDDKEAKKVSKEGFGKFSEPKLVSYYDTYPSKYGNDWSKTPTKKEFIKLAKKEYQY